MAAAKKAVKLAMRQNGVLISFKKLPSEPCSEITHAHSESR